MAIRAATHPKPTMHALDFAASRARATAPDLADYRVLHFATHGVLDDEHPALSGLVFSLVDERGTPQDGFPASWTSTAWSSWPTSWS
jgi:CHAT domain-containing protein